MATAIIRSEFENVSPGVVGVVVVDDEGKRQGIAVKPNETVWLSEDEEIATANAPRRDEDNPFAKGWLVLKTPAAEIKSRRPIGSTTEGIAPARESVPVPEPAAPEVEGNEPVDPPREERPPQEEVGAPPLPEGDPEHGVRAPHEEVGVPEAVAKASAQQRRPQATRAQTVKAGSPMAKPAAKPGKPQGVVVTPTGPQYAGERE